jgi:RNA polymerase sigma-70 factor (ECF subfamily)
VGTSANRSLGRDVQTLFGLGTLGGLSDGKLLELFAAERAEAAFEALVRRHGPMVWGVCRRVLGDHHDAEDAFQATFLVLARKRHSIAHQELVVNWLYRVAYRTAMKARSTRAKRRMRESPATNGLACEAVSPPLRDDLTEILDQELSRLPEQYRIPIVLCDLEGNTHRQAAEQLGWPIGTVSGRLSRARGMLAKRLVRYGMSVSGGALASMLAQDAALGSVPNKLIDSTTAAATLIAAGQTLAAGAVPAEVAALTEGVLRVMLFSKIKFAAGFLVGLALVAGGSAVAYRTQAGEGPGQRNGTDDSAKEAFPGSAERQPGVVVGEPQTARRRVVSQLLLDAGAPQGTVNLGELINLDDPTPHQLEFAKRLVEALIETDQQAEDKEPQELDEMIRDAMDELEAARIEVRVMEARIKRLKKIKESIVTGGSGRPAETKKSAADKADTAPIVTGRSRRRAEAKKSAVGR